MKKSACMLRSFVPIFILILIIIMTGCSRKSISPKPYVKPEHARIQLRNDIVFLTAGQLAQKIRSRELTSVEVVEAFLSQIYKYNPKLNAVVTVDAEGALTRARQADEALDKGEIWGPLHGVPMTIKDQIATQSIRTTSGHPRHSNFVPDVDATVVARLKEAGTIILGKTNLPMYGLDVQTNNPLFGRTNNPWDLDRTPGGSTGGGAAALAAGLSPLEIGTDGGGSIRMPAHFCGVFGFKPTENRVSLAHASLGADPSGAEFTSVRHMITVGPLARSIEDLKLAFSIISGSDVKDVNVPEIPIVYPKPRPLNKLRIAWTDQFPGYAKVSKDTRDAMKKLAEKLAARGITVEKINPPDFDFDEAAITASDLIDMEAFAVKSPLYLRILMSLSGIHAFRPDGNMVFVSYEKYLNVLTRRDNFISKMETFLSDYDAWLCPVAVTSAYKHIHPKRWAGPIAIYGDNDIMVDGKPNEYWATNAAYTVIFSMTGNPVVSMPIGLTKENLPVNVQVVGSRWNDARLLTVAQQLFEAGGDFRHPTDYMKN